MVTIAIVRPQDCFFRPNRFHRNLNPSSCPNSMRPRRRKRSPQGSPDRSRGQDRSVVAKFPAKNLVMGQVKILKRSEDLTPTSVAKRSGQGLVDDVLVLCSTDRLGPEPEMVQKQIKVSDLKVVDGVYAGSAACFASPPPSSLPIPAFFAKKDNNAAATSDLRRLLGLDFV